MEEKAAKQKVLFYCRRNAVRSQMAEAFLRTFFPERYEVCSAGILISTVHPKAVRVMSEIGIDLSGYHAKNIEEFIGSKFDYVSRVCGGDPPDECPFFPQEHEKPINCLSCNACCEFMPFFPTGQQILYASFEDPAKFVGSEEDSLNVFRKVRDEIRDWIIETFAPEQVTALPCAKACLSRIPAETPDR